MTEIRKRLALGVVAGQSSKHRDLASHRSREIAPLIPRLEHRPRWGPAEAVAPSDAGDLNLAGISIPGRGAGVISGFFRKIFESTTLRPAMICSEWDIVVFWTTLGHGA